MKRSLVAIGGNVGSVSLTFQEAIRLLRETDEVSVIAVSEFHRSRPMGVHAGEEFLNAAVLIETNLKPLELLDRLQQIENSQGRVREQHWGPRTLDLDLICYGDLVINEPRLQIPHPACWYRRFVLDPVVEIAGDFVHPEWRISFQELRNRLLVRPLPVAICSDNEQQGQQLAERIQREFPELHTKFFSVAETPIQIQKTLFFYCGEETVQGVGPDGEQAPFIKVEYSLVDEQFNEIRTIISAALG